MKFANVIFDFDQSKGRGFQLMRTIYDHMLEACSPERVLEVQGRVFALLESYEVKGSERATPMDGTARLLPWLAEQSYRCAIVSSNGTGAIEQSLKQLGLQDFFTGVFGRHPSLRLKPYPDQNRACLQSLSWKAEETLLVGDSPDDIESAKPLEIFTVGISSGLAKRERLIDAGAHVTVESLSDLPGLLQRG
jgi:HAD superfamily hydrolase (TIGR01549 family)